MKYEIVITPDAPDGLRVIGQLIYDGKTAPTIIIPPDLDKPKDGPAQPTEIKKKKKSA